MKYIFGPVPSRRLGQSLGIDPIPLKTCNWNCVYCQLGRSRPLVNDRKQWTPPDDILTEIRQVLDDHQPGDIDWITFVGSGEPILHSDLGIMIQSIKAHTDIPIAVITNGSLLYLSEVRKDLMLADAILPSLDAGTPELYRRINRPHPDITFERHTQGLIAFRQEYSGKLWLEVMLVRGMNDTEQALRQLAQMIHRIQPDQVHIVLPTRPPVETWVTPSDAEGLARATAILGEIATIVLPPEGEFHLTGQEDLIEAIVGIITRHPMRQEELERTLAHWAPGQVETALAKLEASGKAQVIDRLGVRFWSAASSFFPDQGQSQRAAPNTIHDRDRQKKKPNT